MDLRLNIPIDLDENSEYREKIALKILEIFEAEKLDIETCELILHDTGVMLKSSCRVCLKNL